ncbi:MAG: phosphomannomutase/phosphoglucomutase [Acidobacteriota bacterium]
MMKMMRWQIEKQVPQNSYDYFERTLMTPNGFREYDVRWLLGKEVNPNGFTLLGKSYGTYAKRVLGQSKVVVGHDFRKYSQDLCNAFILGLLASGMDVVDIGMALSPMLYFSQHLFNCKAGAMITASHNENGWTGIKIACGLSATLGPDDIIAFRKIVEGGDYETGKGFYESTGVVYEDYKNDALKDGPLPKKLKVVLAAGNGTAGRFVPQALRELGCEVVELDCTPDWDFKRYNPNPEDVSFLHSISDATKASKADVGIGIDGDGDRIGIVDDQGHEIFSDILGLLLARSICPKYPGRAVVIDVKSTGLYYDDPILKASKTPIVTWKTGHSYIKAKVAETNALAGFEKSGHWFLNTPIGRGYDDAVVSTVEFLRMLAAAGKPLSQLAAELPKTWNSPTLGPYCADDAKYKVVDGVTANYEKDKAAGTKIGGETIKEIITVNGVRFVLNDDSWGLVRASSNKPSLVIVAESRKSRDQMYDIVEHMQARLAATGQVGEYDQTLPPR